MTPEDSAWTPLSLLQESEALRGESYLANVANSIFDYTQFLLDDDESLTKTGNLNGAAKTQLRTRTLELLGFESENENVNEAEDS